MKVLALGSKNFTLGFKLTGIRKTQVVDENNFINVFDEGFNNPEYGIIIVEDDFYQMIPQRTKEKLEKTVSPIVVNLAYEEGQTSDLRMMIKKAFGLDLMGE